MTPEEFEKIAVWMGWRTYNGWWRCGHPAAPVQCGRVSRKTSLTPAECYEVLERLVEKGYLIAQSASKETGYSIEIAKVERAAVRTLCSGEDYFATQHEAIESAILALLKAEGGKE